MTRASLVAAVAAVIALTSACGGGDSDPPAGPDTESAGPTTDEQAQQPGGEMLTKATIRKVTGSMKPAARDRVRDTITTTVDTWFESAYLGGDYPRTDFGDAFEVFTDGAKVRATQDRTLMSNAAVGTTTFSVRALARRVKIDVLARGGRASAVTVDFRLGMTRAGDTGAERTERIAGHLYLTHEPGDGWQVFGYDVQRGEIA